MYVSPGPENSVLLMNLAMTHNMHELFSRIHVHVGLRSRILKIFSVNVMDPELLVLAQSLIIRIVSGGTHS